ncbi:uncharacterized protein LOC105703588 [Orussus abietinus]|uniref:uncharacterized protein LOC105703588 n=1 Tax=Orussus abietinus TaxID=222816 RepID=UPI000624FB46|nr:uncharacterized protein LOC105703588 [Orussus abietinus]
MGIDQGPPGQPPSSLLFATSDFRSQGPPVDIHATTYVLATSSLIIESKDHHSTTSHRSTPLVVLPTPMHQSTSLSTGTSVLQGFKMKVAFALVAFGFLGACLASPLEKIDKIGVLEQQSVTLTDRAKYEEELLRKLNSKCSQNDISSCVMLKLVTYMNKLLKKASIELTDDIEIRKTSQVTEEVSFQTGRSKDDDSEVLDLIVNKVYAFVKSRSVKWRILPEDDVVVSASEDETGSLNLGLSIERADSAAVQDGRGKKGGNMGALLAAAVLKIGLIGGLAFKGLALLVGKALLLSKIALLLAGIIGLKKLFSHQKHVTYEVVAHPHHSSSHTYSSDHGHGDSYSSGWARSFHGPAPVPGQPDAHDLAYSAHVK